MDKVEKMIRCSEAPTRERMGKPIGHCRVYSRWVRDCHDCSFSWRTRILDGSD